MNDWLTDWLNEWLNELMNEKYLFISQYVTAVRLRVTIYHCQKLISTRKILINVQFVACIFLVAIGQDFFQFL